ncbi:HDOD domain-containing protein [uncultured Azonexus sp.]|uniref:HDOD domain-containing protein n=1 Tax=uncultured Azonexus sp. TaxID=520307 RepID=UPI00260F136D|nr:HDOD domain-containing protein [uncultured Azonexus sp.]
MAHSKTYELSHDDLNKVMASVDIPVCPGVLTEAMSEAQKDEPDIRRLADIITADPGMSAAALKLANSPLYGSGRAVSSVRNAVERLGTKNIVCVVVASALRASITGLPAAWLEQFWRRTSMMALAASLIARRLYGISPDAAYTYTLFHDAAIPLMMKRFPNYGEVLEKCEREGMLLEQAEAQFFPCTHPIVGSLLVRNWGLPPILGQAIRFHHEPDAYDLPDRTLPGGALSFIAVTQVAEHLLAEIQQGEDLEVGSALFERAIDYLGISPDDLDRLRQQVNAAIEDASLA